MFDIYWPHLIYTPANTLYYIGIIVILYLYSITDDTSHPDYLLHKHCIISWSAATSSSETDSPQVQPDKVLSMLQHGIHRLNVGASTINGFLLVSSSMTGCSSSDTPTILSKLTFLSSVG